MRKLALAALPLAMSAAACASITRGTNEAFTVNTNPSGAHVTLSTGQTCDATPCTFARISRKAEFSVTIEKAGYRTTTHAITHHTAGAGAAGMAGNVLVGGIIGGLIDANSGATQDLVPNPLSVDLELETGAPTPVTAAAVAPVATTTPAAASTSATTTAPTATAPATTTPAPH